MTLHPSPLRIRECSPDRTPAQELINAMAAETAALLGGDGTLGDRLDSSDLSAINGGVYLVGWVDQEPVAGGGLRIIGSRVAEIKRMYVRPLRRGHGHGSVLLSALEGVARQRGCHRVRLDAGAHQVAAQRVYRRAGYRRIPAYNDDRFATFWGEKHVH